MGRSTNARTFSVLSEMTFVSCITCWLSVFLNLALNAFAISLQLSPQSVELAEAARDHLGRAPVPSKE